MVYGIDGRPVFSEYSLPNYGKHGGKRDCDSDKQAPVTQKQKATDHIDEELRLAIFKTLKLSQFLFFSYILVES